MKYVNEQYQKQLDDLAETLMATRREQLAEPIGQLSLFDNVIYAEHRFQTPIVTELPPRSAA